MILEGKPLEAINEAELQTLVDNQVAEGKSIEYKESLPGHSDRHKKEFLADVSSFANASGGHLILGMKEIRGVASEVCGFSVDSQDEVILRLDSIIRDGIEPRIPSISIQPILLKTSKVAIVIRIPRSWTLPHMVKFKGSSKFYSRNSAGKYQLDVAELRSLFALSETTGERIRNFRAERLAMIVAGETPIALHDHPKIVLHMIPLSAFDPALRLDLGAVINNYVLLSPINSGVSGCRHNFDGFLTYDQFSQSGSVFSYCQIFRTGIIESVETRLLQEKEAGKPCIPSIAFEGRLIDAARRYLSVHKQLGVDPPVFVMVSLLEVSGYVLATSQSVLPREVKDPIDRDTLLVPEILVEAFDIDPDKALRPIFDAVWNAAGWPGSQNYDKDGRWVGR